MIYKFLAMQTWFEILVLVILTKMPPGRLMADRSNTESRREKVSTFHLFCCTWCPDVCIVHVVHTITITSITLPTTTSPISPLYLHKVEVITWFQAINAVHYILMLPRLERSNTNQLVNPLHHSSYRCYKLVISI